MTTSLLFELAAFLLGLLLGSFLNVCISRLPAHKSIIKPRSHCPQCLAPIRWYDNIPLLSWVLLAAKCHSCKGSIPWRYPAVELGVGVWFAFLALRAAGMMPTIFPVVEGIRVYSAYPVSYVIPATVGTAILGFLLIGLIVMDWQTHTLPDAFTLTGGLIGFVLIFIQGMFLAPGQGDIHFDPRNNLRMSSPGSFVAKGDVFMTGPEHLVLGRLLAILCAAGLLWFIRWAYKQLRGREGLGFGDVKLIGMIAAFLGFWPAILALFLGVVMGSVYALTLMARGKATPTTRLPLGTFISIGGLFSALAGASLIAWYQSLL